MSGWGSSWGFLGIPGIKELVLVAVVTLVLYGRSGLFQSRHLRVLRPWIAPAVRRRPTTAPVNTPATGQGDRLFWVLAITAATAVAALIVTRMLIISASGPSR